MADQAPLPERIADIQRIIRISSAGEFADENQAKRLLIQLAQAMLSEAELATLPESERLELYQGLEATIAQLKRAVGGGDRPDPGA
jgi:hypothetical protein